MAGQKLSARQKMINMMYLVLTAMLALNVSAELLQAFESLRNSLAATASTHGSHNDDLAVDIIRTIEAQEQSGNTKYSYVRPVIQNVNEQSSKTITYLDGLIATLEEFGGKDPQTGEITKRDEQEANYRFWMGENDQASSGHGNGEAVELRKKSTSSSPGRTIFMNGTLPISAQIAFLS